MLSNKQKKKNLRTERKNAKVMFNEIVISNDCLVIILSFVTNSVNLQELQDISLVNKQWRNIISTNCKILKEIRLICYGTIIHKAYINTNEHPIEVFREMNKPKSCWSRIILYPNNKLRCRGIYETTYKGEKGIWDYEK